MLPQHGGLLCCQRTNELKLYDSRYVDTTEEAFVKIESKLEGKGAENTRRENAKHENDRQIAGHENAGRTFIW